MEVDDSLELYDYSLPDSLIARAPAERRDASRLMVLRRRTGSLEHRTFTDLPDLLAPGDLMVMNDTRVVPARLVGFRTRTGGKWEGLFLRDEGEGRWRLIGQTRGKLTADETLTLVPAGRTSPEFTGCELVVTLEENLGEGEWVGRPDSSEPTLQLLARFGTMPLPPYMHREARPEDWERYQTTYATRPGAVAAPTAGLHFTPEILQRCRERGIESARVTLHIGLGTFRPVTAARLSEHRMHHEWCELPAETVEAVHRTRSSGGRVVAVGTTSVRTLEAVAQAGPLREWRGETNLFIKPPFEFRAVDALVTNFHLPGSTLLVLVSTFAGRERVLRAYREAVRERYRFYSYGDAMLIV